MKQLIKALSGLAAVFVVLGLTSVSASATSSRPAESASMSAAYRHGGVSASRYRMNEDIPLFPSQCHGNEWCIFTGTDFSGTQCISQGNPVSLTAPCRNADESIANIDSLCGAAPNDHCAMRIYYHPFNIDNGGAHTCIDYGKSIDNLDHSNLTFNSNTGDGFGLMVWRNVGGVSLSSGTCSNPIEPGR